MIVLVVSDCERCGQRFGAEVINEDTPPKVCPICVTLWITAPGGKTPNDEVSAYDQLGWAHIAKKSGELYLVEAKHANLPHVFPVYRRR